MFGRMLQLFTLPMEVEERINDQSRLLSLTDPVTRCGCNGGVLRLAKLETGANCGGGED